LQEAVFNKEEVIRLINFYCQLADNGIKEYDRELLIKLIKVADDLNLNTDRLKQILNDEK